MVSNYNTRVVLEGGVNNKIDVPLKERYQCMPDTRRFTQEAVKKRAKIGTMQKILITIHCSRAGSPQNKAVGNGMTWSIDLRLENKLRKDFR